MSDSSNSTDYAVERYSLRYTPSPDSIYREEHLPEPRALEGNSLAFRRELHSQADLQKQATGFLASSVIVITLGVIIAGLFGTLMDPMHALSAGAVFSLILIIREFAKGTANPTRLLVCLVGPSLILTTLSGLGALTVHYRIWVATISGMVGALVFLFCQGTCRAPFALFVSYLLAHPRLLPKTRAEFSYSLPEPDWKPLFGFLGAVTLLAIYNASFAALAVLVVTLAYFVFELRDPNRREKLRSEWAVTSKVLGLFLTWENKAMPGVWTAEVKPRRIRRMLTMLSIVPIFLAAVLGVHAFGLVDIQIGVLEWHMDAKLPADLKERLIEEPFYWLALPLLAGKPVFFLFAGLSLLLLLTLPAAAILLSLRPLAAAILELEQEIDLLDRDNRSDWQWYVDRIQQSGHEVPDLSGKLVRESSHFYMGYEPTEKAPVLLGPDILREHAYIVGNTGSGKTSLGMMPLLFQILDQPEQDTREPASPVVILDLKGDHALFNLAREAAERRAEKRALAQGKSPEEVAEAKARAFRFFSPEKGKASHHFNPFSNMLSGNRSLMQLATLFLDALSLNHGEGYGRSYYSRKNRMILQETLAAFPDVQSFDELYFRVKSKSTKADLRDALELVATLSAMSQYAALGPAAGPEPVIHMPDVLEEGQVVYFWLPAALESVSVREIGKLALYSLLTACIDRQRQGLPHRQCYLFIDEFQRIAGENFKIILEQARSFGLGAILANQTISDLVTPDADLRSTVRTNARLKMYFGVTDPQEMLDISNGSGEEIALMKSSGESYSDDGRVQVNFSRSQVLKKKITVNDLLRLTDSPTEYLFQVTRGQGYTQFGGQPVITRTDWPVTQEVYEKASATPLPDAVEDFHGQGNLRSPEEIDRDAEKQRLQELEEAMEEYHSEFPELEPATV